MDATWIVSANAGRARIFSQARGADALEEINDMVNTPAREPVRATETDELGQLSAGKSRHGAGAPSQENGYQQHQTPPQHQEELFARDLAHFLVAAHDEGRFKELSLADGPAFLSTVIDAFVEFLDARPNFRTIAFGRHDTCMCHDQASAGASNCPPPKLECALTCPPGVTFTAQYLNSGIFPNGSSAGLVNTLAAAS